MPEVVRRRTIRPSTRQASSVNHRVHLGGLSSGDTLLVEITHESKPFRKTYKFLGSDVLRRKSLGFKVLDFGTHIDIQWISTQPLN